MLCKYYLWRGHHKSACRVMQAFCYLSPTTHYSVPVCLRFRPLLCVSLVRTEFDLACAMMWCTKEPLIAWYQFSMRLAMKPCVCVCVCLFLLWILSAGVSYITPMGWQQTFFSHDWCVLLSAALWCHIFFRTLALPHPFPPHYKGE